MDLVIFSMFVTDLIRIDTKSIQQHLIECMYYVYYYLCALIRVVRLCAVLLVGTLTLLESSHPPGALVLVPVSKRVH